MLKKLLKLVVQKPWLLFLFGCVLMASIILSATLNIYIAPNSLALAGMLCWLAALLLSIVSLFKKNQIWIAIMTIIASAVSLLFMVNMIVSALVR